MKEHQDQNYGSLEEFKKKFLAKINSIHLKATKDGNKKRGKYTQDCDEIYKLVITAKYVCVKCNIHKKCRFAFWYSFDGEGENIFNIKYCRNINQNHDIEWHKESGIF
jgi:hypothetical protein